MSCGNDGPWKAWKAKSRLPTLSTVLGKPAKAAGFPHSHSFDNWSLYKGKTKKAGPPAGPKTVISEGGPQQTAEVGQNHLPNAWVRAAFHSTHLVAFLLKTPARVPDA